MGQPRNDTEAVKWFRTAADLVHDYALDNLGRMYWQGRGGLTIDRVQAVKLYRTAAYRDNPWGRLHLAEALEKGEGTQRNAAEALDLYRAVAAQDREPDAKRQARDALARLGANNATSLIQDAVVRATPPGSRPAAPELPKKVMKPGQSRREP